MNKQGLYWGFLSLFLLLASGFFYQRLHADKAAIPSPLIDHTLPEFSAALLTSPEQIFHSKQLRGRYTVLNVWATWCTTCISEHQFWLDKRATKPAYQLVGLNYRDDSAHARDYLAAAGNPYDVVLADVDGKIGIDLGIVGTPQTYVIDPQGVIVYKHSGPIDERVWVQSIQPLLNAIIT